ncbi:hypothetical protein O3P69_008655 [Scylla paramamosain]|uniref:Uncharacterized protein n=1 Tax=Scylla paramamosain TaxID=85552 RepID=A0AAW0SMF9_SCYPA
MEQTIRAAATSREITLSTPPTRETVDESRQREGISEEIGEAMGGGEARPIHAAIPLRPEELRAAELSPHRENSHVLPHRHPDCRPVTCRCVPCRL